jgi:simple sugar transport system ATP-binding protein
MEAERHRREEEDVLRVSHVSKHYGGLKALDDVSFAVRKGEVHCLAGANGSGKSTIIKIIAGVERQDSGEVTLDGDPIRTGSSQGSIQHGVQVIYQDPSLFLNLTVAENIVLPSILSNRARTVRWREIREQAIAAAEKIQLHVDLDALVGSLSFAQQQLVAICRALSRDVKLLIMDEPTTALARHEVEILLGVVRNLQTKGISVLFVSHKLNEVFEVSQRFTILRDGKCLGTFDSAQLNVPRLSSMMMGQEIESHRFSSEAKQRPVLLRVTNLSKQGQFDRISFELHEGEVLGLTGLLGSGRTELALALFGMNHPDQGEVSISGKPVRIRTVSQATRLGIAYVPEDRIRQGLVIGQSIAANIILATCDRLLNRFGLIDGSQRAKVIQRWIERLKIKISHPDSPVETLSGGNQQRVVIARWLAIRPKVLILDGPTVGIDVGAKRSVHELIQALANEGVGVLLITDEIDEALANCGRVLLMRAGRIIAEVNAAEEDEMSVQKRLEAA